jgi:hypothetical protein
VIPSRGTLPCGSPCFQDHLGFDLLNALTLTVPDLSDALPVLLQLAMARLTNSKVRSLVLSATLFVCIFGTPFDFVIGCLSLLFPVQTNKLVRSLLEWLGLYFGRFGAEAVVASLNRMQPGLWDMLYKNIIIANANTVTSDHGRQVRFATGIQPRYVVTVLPFGVALTGDPTRFRQLRLDLFAC